MLNALQTRASITLSGLVGHRCSVLPRNRSRVVCAGIIADDCFPHQPEGHIRQDQAYGLLFVKSRNNDVNYRFIQICIPVLLHKVRRIMNILNVPAETFGD